MSIVVKILIPSIGSSFWLFWSLIYKKKYGFVCPNSFSYGHLFYFPLLRPSSFTLRSAIADSLATSKFVGYTRKGPLTSHLPRKRLPRRGQDPPLPSSVRDASGIIQLFLNSVKSGAVIFVQLLLLPSRGVVNIAACRSPCPNYLWLTHCGFS